MTTFVDIPSVVTVGAGKPVLQGGHSLIVVEVLGGLHCLYLQGSQPFNSKKESIVIRLGNNCFGEVLQDDFKILWCHKTTDDITVEVSLHDPQVLLNGSRYGQSHHA